MSLWVLEIDGKSRPTTHIVADVFSAEECAALTERLDIVNVEKVDARVAITYKPSELHAVMQINADIVQECVVSLGDVRSRVTIEEKRIWLMAERAEKIDPLDLDAPDTLEPGKLDLRDVIGEEISLHLPDYPRAEESGENLSEDCQPRNPEATAAFASLAVLKQPE